MWGMDLFNSVFSLTEQGLTLCVDLTWIGELCAAVIAKAEVFFLGAVERAYSRIILWITLTAGVVDRWSSRALLSQFDSVCRPETLQEDWNKSSAACNRETDREEFDVILLVIIVSPF